nr:MAG TPA: HNH endonuclease bacteriophage, HNH Endonuclease, DNA.52A [Caudoviricetes sp.]
MPLIKSSLNTVILAMTFILGSVWMEKSKNSRRLQPKRLHNFYKSDLWHKLSEGVILRAKGRCEVCGKPGTEVHHKIHLTLDSLDD